MLFALRLVTSMAISVVSVFMIVNHLYMMYLYYAVTPYIIDIHCLG